jgi:hypothetical protein
VKRTIATVVVLAGVLLVAGCRRGGGVTRDLNRPSAAGKHHGEIVQPRFTVDSRALFGRAVPMGKDRNAFPKVGDYVLWDAATGEELRRLPVEDAIERYEPGTADGKHWLAFGRSGSYIGRFLLVDFTPDRRVSDVPGAPGPDRVVSRPSFSQDFGRMAYSDYRASEQDRQGHVLARTGDGWTRLVSVAGQGARLSPDGGRVATITRGAGPGDLAVCVWSVPDGRRVWSAPCRNYGLHGFTADGRYVAQGAQSDWRLHDAATGDVRLTLKAEDHRFQAAYADGRVRTATQRPHGQGVVLETWDAATGRLLGQRDVPAGATLSRTENEPFTAARLAVVLGSEERPVPDYPRASVTVWSVDVYDPSQEEPVATLKTSGLSSVLVSPDGSVAAALTYGGPQFFRLQ